MTPSRFVPFAVALALAGCRTDRAAPTTISSTPETQTPAPAPAPAPAPLGAGKAAAIERAYTREAFDAWRARRAAEVAPATVEHRVDDIFKCLNCEDLLVTERVIEGGVCRQGPWILNIAKDDGQPTRLDAASIATDCCDASCPDRSPAAWMLELNRILEQRDAEALRALVSPTEGLQVASGFSDGEDSSHADAKIGRDGDVDEVFTIIQPVQLFSDQIGCPDTFDAAGEAACDVHGGGFGASYRWRRAPAGAGSVVYLLDVSQQSH